MTADHKRCQKLEQRADLYTHGHTTRAAAANKQVGDLFGELEVASVEHECFARLQQAEQLALSARVEQLRELVSTQSSRELNLQRRYANLRKAAEEYANSD